MGLNLFFHPICSITFFNDLSSACKFLPMSAEFKFQKHEVSKDNTQGTVKLTDLLLRMNKEKKREKQINFFLSVAAVSFVSVFGIILTI